MTMKISAFTIDNYDPVMALWQQTEGVGLSSADARESIQSYLERNPGLSFIAVEDGQLVGAVLSGHDGRRGYIHHLAVHPNYRRQGIGRQLVDRCMAVLQAAGIQKCHLFIFHQNHNGIGFWQSVGWARRSDIGVMSKNIG
ncbi:MAG: GNAT family N-acetyltransferase [Anaerolineae bacterium]|nr:GNAT family N-acetyltransferase [Anaerolineae bacterium]